MKLTFPKGIMALHVSPLLLPAALLALLVGSGVVHGLITDRWGSPGEDAAPQLRSIPLTIGDWEGSQIELRPEEYPTDEPGGMFLRRYVNRANGAAVTMFLSSGRAGPMVAGHQPDSCYPGAGFKWSAPMTKRAIPSGSAGASQEFRVATFSKTERASPMHVRVYWSWSANGNWQAPDSPRLTFAGQRRLYKLYVIRQLTKPEEPLDGDQAASFIQSLVPEVDKVLFQGH